MVYKSGDVICVGRVFVEREDSYSEILGQVMWVEVVSILNSPKGTAPVPYKNIQYKVIFFDMFDNYKKTIAYVPYGDIDHQMTSKHAKKAKEYFRLACQSYSEVESYVSKLDELEEVLNNVQV
jgi:hypothetical protein